MVFLGRNAFTMAHILRRQTVRRRTLELRMLWIYYSELANASELTLNDVGALSTLRVDPEQRQGRGRAVNFNLFPPTPLRSTTLTQF
jgi:hypothetical protein